MTDKIRELIAAHINVSHFEIMDDSHKHAHHAGARESGGGHYLVLVVSDDFEGVSRVRRHRMIYEALKSIKDHIHALGIRAYTSDEYQR